MGLQDQLNAFNEKINRFIAFIGGKLANFKNLSIGEQISYIAIGLGIILVLTGVVLYII